MTDNNIVYVKCIDTIHTILDCIRNGKPGMYLRFGDGDFNLAENRDDQLARSNEELKQMMLNAMSIRDDRILICLPHHCKTIHTLEEGMYPGNHEYPYEYITRFLDILKRKTNTLPEKIYTNVALSYCSVVNPDVVVELHQQIKKYEVVYIGNYQYSNEFLTKLFGNNMKRINTHWRDAFEQRNFVFHELDEYMNHKKDNYFVIIIAAGCSSRAFASVIYDTYFLKNPNFYLFDYGSLLDYLYGMNTRAYMDLMPPKKEYILERICNMEEGKSNF